jgi:hypothetical protein
VVPVGTGEAHVNTEALGIKLVAVKGFGTRSTTNRRCLPSRLAAGVVFQTFRCAVRSLTGTPVYTMQQARLSVVCMMYILRCSMADAAAPGGMASGST